MKVNAEVTWSRFSPQGNAVRHASLAKSPTKTIRTQSNHFFACIYAFVKLERIKIATKTNHFALRSRIYLKAIQAAYKELRRMQVPELDVDCRVIS